MPPAHDDPLDLLANLTPAQREAVLCTEGPLLVLAGPGSGKTRVITRRIAHLIGKGVAPWRILAVTFTNKAAGEMRHRVAAVLADPRQGGDLPPEPPRGLTVTTFHSLCVRLLRRYADLWNAERSAAADGQARPAFVAADFTVYDADDQQALMKRVLSEMQLSGSNWPPRSVLGVISQAKNELKDSRDFAATAGDFHSRTVAKVFERYDAALRAANAVDFDDLLLLTARMLRESSAVRDEVRRRYRYLLVDEYQDTNRAQLVIAMLIAGEETGGEGAGEGEGGARGGVGRAGLPNICVVGDPDQSIYGWRGADIANILQFEEHYPSARVIALGENFRSLPPIINAADRLIRRNTKRKHKPLIAMRGGGGPGGDADGSPGGAALGKGVKPVEIVLCRDEHHEAAVVLDWLRARQEAGEIAWKDAAVFYRTNALSRVMEDALRGASIPYTIVRGTAFYQREEVKNALAYLRVLANPADEVSLARIVNVPARGIGDTSWGKVEQAAREAGVPTLAMARSAGGLSAVLPARAAGAVGKFVAMLDAWLPARGVPGEREDAGVFAEAADDGGDDEPAPEGALAALVERVVRESGLEPMYREEEERLENLSELVSSAREFEEAFRAEALDDGEPDAAAAPARAEPTLRDLLLAYLERVALVADVDALDPSRGAVTLMTLHAAKGLEFPAVAVIGLEEGILPHFRGQESEAEMEEERRLCFVGVTRAMDRLLMTSARYRTIRGLSERMIESRFIDELRGEGVSLSDQSGGLNQWTEDEFVERGGAGPGRAQPRQSSAEGGRTGGGSGSRAGGGGSAPFRVGAKVRHPQFGPGEVEAVTAGSDARVRVRFPSVGTKTLVLAYARLEALER